MSYSLTGVLAKCGIKDPGTQPFSATCPLCQTSDGLEIRSPNHVVCRCCDFIGDIYELYAAHTHQTLEHAMAELGLDGLTHFSDVGLASYLGDRARNTELIKVWRTAQERLRGVPDSIRANLQHLACYRNDAHFKKLSNYLGAMRGEDFETLELNDLDKVAQTCIRSMGRYTCLAIPCWSESLVTGFWFVQERAFEEGFTYLHLQNELASLGFGHAVSPMDDLCFVVNDPRVAVRFMARQLWDEGTPAVFVVPSPWSRTPAHLLGCRDVIFFPTFSGPEHTRRYVDAARFFTGGAKIVLDSKLKFAPLTQWPDGRVSANGILRVMKDQALPAYQALGAFLLTKTQPEAARHASVWGLDMLEQNQVISCFGGTDATFLKRCFESNNKINKVMFDGQQIMETREGWSCDEKIISEAIIRIDEVNTNRDTGVTFVIGSISFVEHASGQTQVITFKEDLAQIEKNPAAWLKRFVLTNGGWCDVSPKWSNKLMGIAKKFSAARMSVVATDKPYGWGQDKVLRFNRFLIDQNGISRAVSRVTGPDVPYPSPLTASEAEVFGSKEFCMTLLVMLGNLYRTANHQPGYSIAVPSSPHVVERIAGAFNLSVERNPELPRVEREAGNPLPIFAAWSDDQLANLFRQAPPAHVMTSVDSRTFLLMSVHPGWVRLPVEGLAEYQALRWIFYGMTPLLLDGIQLPDDGYFFSNVAKKVGHLVGRLKPQHQMLIAAADLDHHCLLSRSSWGTQTARLLRLLVDSGELACEPVPDGYRILHQDVIRAMASPILPPPNIQKLTKQLADGKMLIDMGPTYWVLNGTVWDLVASNLMN